MTQATMQNEIDELKRYQIYTMSLVATGVGALSVAIGSAGGSVALYPMGLLVYLGGALLYGLAYAEKNDGRLRSLFVKVGLMERAGSPGEGA